MFGLFKKPDATKSATDCHAAWVMLSDRDKKTVAENIEKFVEALSTETSNSAGALSWIAEYKQAVIRQYQINDIRHPAFIQLQIISDYIFSRGQGFDVHAKCVLIFEDFISPLPEASREKILRSLNQLF
jgi:hypothetical protein